MSQEIDFDSVDEAQGFSPIPEDWYLCQLSEVEEKQTANGDPMWSLKWEIIEGEYEGRYVWDNLVFVPAVYGRIKLLLSRCGVAVKGKFSPSPAMIEGKTVKVETEHNSYEKDGKTITNNSVTFDGYDYADSTAPEDSADDRENVASSGDSELPPEDDVPF